MTRKPIFSGEPLPVAPTVSDPEITAFHRKLLDYIRRLQSRLDQLIDVGPSLEIFSAYLDADQVFGAAGVVDWTVILRQDTPYALQANEEEIRFLQDGFYIILLDLLINAGATVTTWIYEAGVQDFQLNYGDSTIAAAGTLSASIPLPIEKNLGVGFEINAGTVLKAGSRLTIVRLFDDFSGGTSKTPGIGWDPSTPGGGISTDIP